MLRTPGMVLVLYLLILSANNAYAYSSDPFYTYSSQSIYDLSEDSDYVTRDDEPVVSSCELYNQEGFMSSLILCHGGDLPFLSDYNPSESEEDEDDDDEDDDDDGHSSMLSNTSLQQRRWSETVEEERLAGTSIHMRGGSVVSRPFMAKKTSTTFLSKALALRGGDISSEVLRRLFVTALVTVIFEGLVGHVLEFLKIVMQTSEKTYTQVIREITADKGVAGLWDGFVPWGVVQSIFKGAVFGVAYASAIGFLKPLAEQGYLPKQVASLLAGGIAGGFQGYVLSPTLLLKTRVMTNPVFRESMSMLQTTWMSFLIGFEIVAKEGVMTLMKGANVFATKRVFDWGSRYFFADLFERAFQSIRGDEPLTLIEKSASSLLGGVASTCVTLPLDVLVAKTQDAKKAGVKVNPFKMFQEELQQKGISGLQRAYMRGFEARLAHVCLTTLVVKTGTDLAYNHLFPPAVS